METFTFIRSAGSGAVLQLTRTAMASAGLAAAGELLLSHGARRARAVVTVAPDEGQQLMIGASLADELGLVESIPYRLSLTGSDLRIGPVIGILIAGRTSAIQAGPGSRAHEIILRYQDVGGLVYLFALDGVDLAAETIAGYAWVPGTTAPVPECVWRHWESTGRYTSGAIARARAEADELPHDRLIARYQGVREQFLREVAASPHGLLSGEPSPVPGSFVKGHFPFPSALWLRWHAPGNEACERLWERVGPHIFNVGMFDKWECHRVLSAFPELRPYLPEIVPFTRFADMFDRLDQHGRIVLNQQGVEKRHCMIQAERDGDGFFLRFGREGRGEYFRTRPRVEERLEPLLSQGRYLVEQYVDLPRYHGRPVDFRVMMQKDGAGRWDVRGMLGRFGRRGAILTNFVTGGYALPVDEALCRAFAMGWRGACRLKERMTDLAYTVGRALDQTGGCYGDLCLDCGIDCKGHLWVLAISQRPFHGLPLCMGDGQMYLEVMTGPLLFASYLAGFGQDRSKGV